MFDLALPAIETFGLEFIWTEVWDPVADNYGALTFIYGTAVTSFIALLLATPLSIAIALFLTEIAPRRLAAPIATMVELLAAIPSVVLGLWGILVFGPWVARNLEPWLESWLGWLPIFSGDPSPAGILPAALVLTIMIVPITSAICRELFARTPRELTDGAMALGSTRWEAIRGVMFAYAAPGHRRGRAARPRPGLRRGDRGHPGDRRRRLHLAVALRAGRHARLEDRVAVPGSDDAAPGGLAPLPRGDPDGHLARHERAGPADRAPVRDVSGGLREHRSTHATATT